MFLTIQTSSFAQEAPNVNNVIYLYGGTSETYKKQLSITNNQVGTVSPNYFNLDAKGNLVAQVDKSFVDYAHQNSYKITPFISNHWDYELGALAMENRVALSQQIAQSIIQNNLDGINVDIENLTIKEKEAQTEFLQLLVDQLRPHGKTVSIAVAPARFDTTYGWVGSYDFEAIGKIVDTVFIMAYDQSYPGGPAGPVSGYPWVKETVLYLTSKIPSQKLVLGVPFYGRYWTDSVKGSGITFEGAQSLIARNNAEIQWDPYHQTSFAKFKDQESETNVEVWFDNGESLKKKISLVKEYNLRGWGAWRLGQEDQKIWGMLSQPENKEETEESTEPFGSSIAQKAGQFLDFKIKNSSSSEFVSHIFKQEGIILPSSISSLSQEGSLISDQTQLKPGDILFFGTSTKNLTAAGIYTGNRQFVVAHPPYGNVKELSLDSSVAQKYYLGAKRVIENPDELTTTHILANVNDYVGLKIKNLTSTEFVAHVFQLEGISVPSRISDLSKEGTLITDQAQLQPGDILFFGTSTSNLTATGIYTGDRAFIVAHPPYGSVKKLSLDSNEAQKYYLGAKRITKE
jgi:spore germination protein YaaH/cell wall-associated NlpC family hydrolase